MHLKVRRGAAAKKSKLTDADIPAIRRMVREGSTQRQVAAKYGVAKTTIYQIISGMTWSHVPDEPIDVHAPQETRARVGERHPGSKLTDAQVVEIRSLSRMGRSITDIARVIGVPYSQVHKVVNRQTWTHVRDGKPADPS
jgi:IS30 family transposase